MRKLILSGLSMLLILQLSAQKINKLIDASETARIEKALSADDMEGRRAFTPSIDKAAAFIANEFASIGIASLNGDGNYLQAFKIARPARWPKDFGPQGDSLSLANVVAILPGKSRPNEYVIFSGHYDHLGINGKRAVNGDSVFNGANDDAAGTTAMIMLAKYFKAPRARKAEPRAGLKRPFGGLLLVPRKLIPRGEHLSLLNISPPW